MDWIYKLELFKRKIAFKLLGWYNITRLEVEYRDKDDDFVYAYLDKEGILHKKLSLKLRGNVF